jgi:hypothetical protein
MSNNERSFKKPSSSEDALNRIDVIDWEIGQINLQLEHFKEVWEGNGELPVSESLENKKESKEEYVQWRESARKAKLWKENEKAFLMRWLMYECEDAEAATTPIVQNLRSELGSMKQELKSLKKQLKSLSSNSA